MPQDRKHRLTVAGDVGANYSRVEAFRHEQVMLKGRFMDEDKQSYTGGCLCGAVRYQAIGEPKASGHCYCCDCRKASGSGFIPFMAFPASAVHLTGKTVAFESQAANGNTATRNSCPICHSLVLGGAIGKDDTYNIYAGSLDDPSLFHPTIAVFTRGRPEWAMISPALKVLDIGK